MLDGTSIRSILFTPALQIERFKRALHLDVDLNLLDLEDSVAPEKKELARENLHAFLSANYGTTSPIAVRINAVGSDFGQNDLQAMMRSARKPDFVVIPKTESRDDIQTVERMLGDDSGVRLIGLVESAKGVFNVDSIASSSPRLAALMFGSADYTRDIGAEICWDSLLVPRSNIAAAAGARGIGAIDTPYFDIPDLVGLLDECERVRRLGFTGRCVIHPSQSEVVNGAFSYSLDAIDRARKIVDAASMSGGNICKVDGQMVGAPIVEKARRILAATQFSEQRFHSIKDI
ncbi:aldolase/citrate lyase family protein [Burkholderia stagnalis]|uniref:aldolase/citrate lyase family protein n=1 Tax=Burkholderia stagnalis TaxID=1503054 RepID=UPI00163AE36D|nr:aldolase/citrate lyase family protein [Burkholderia stagnalis]